jgi:thioredoxin 1
MDKVNIIELDDIKWEEVVEKGKLPIMVMFYNLSCQHCAAMMPYFEKYASEFMGKMVFARIDVAKNPYNVNRYGVMATPTFKFFCGGRSVQEIVGELYPPLLKKIAEDTLTYGKQCASKSTPIDFNIGYV